MKSALAGAINIRSRLAAEVDVGHVVAGARVPLAGVTLRPESACHGDRGDELLGRLGHHHLHGGAGLA